MPSFGFQGHLYSHVSVHMRTRAHTHKKNEDWSGEEGRKKEKERKQDWNLAALGKEKSCEIEWCAASYTQLKAPKAFSLELAERKLACSEAS